MNIKEDYVSFEVAKLLKEKGFDGETEHKIWYVIKQFSTGCHWNSCVYKVGDMTREYDNDCCISMPTLQMACKWLREVHNIDLNVDYKRCDMNVYSVDIVTKNGTKFIRNWNTYEEAVEAAIKYTLKNLIIEL